MPDRFANGDETSDPEGADDWNNDPMKNSLFGGDLQESLIIWIICKDLGSTDCI